MTYTFQQFKKQVQQAKVSKFRKIKSLQDAVNNLLAAPEGCSQLMKESLETLLKIAPKEHVYNDGNDWEVRA